MIFRPILHINKFHFITIEGLINIKKFGDPFRADNLTITMSYKGYDNDREESAPKKKLPEKSLLKKGFLNKPPIKVETPKEEPKHEPIFDETENELHEKIRVLTLKLNECKENEALLIENAKLKKKIENKQKNESLKAQQLIENNLEITGVQQKPNEDLKEIIDRIFTLFSISLNIDLDLSIERKGHGILLKCKRFKTKQLILDKIRGKELNSEDLNLNLSKRRICINGQLTPLNKLIYVKVKALRDDDVFNHVFIRNGKVLVKTKTHGNNNPIHIYSMDQLKELCP